MIYSKLKNWRQYYGFSDHPVWEEAFCWIEKNASTVEEGIYPLTAPNCFVRVMEYVLNDRDDARYESHKNTIDLQYTIQGGEGIEIISVEELTPDGAYIIEKDCQHYKLPVSGTGMVENLEGYFCVLFPQDGHMPKLRIPGNVRVRKLVVKIPIAALS